MNGKLKNQYADAKSTEAISAYTAGFVGRHLTLSRGAVISTALIIIYLVTTGINTVQDGIRTFGPVGVLPEERIAHIEAKELGPWQVELKCEYPCTLEKGTPFIADFQASGLPNYESLAINFISSENDTLSIPFTGAAQKPSIVVNEKVAQSKISQLQLSVQLLAGNKITRTVNMAAFTSVSEAMNQRFDQYPERAYSDVPLNVYLFIGFFGLLVVCVLIAWTFFLVKATSKQRKIMV